METQEERELLYNTIERAMNNKEVKIKDLMNAIYLTAQHYHDNKHKEQF